MELQTAVVIFRLFKSIMYLFKFKKILFVGLFFLFSDAAIEASSLKKVRRSVARLQMELLELKEYSSKIAAQQMAVLEPQNEGKSFVLRSNKMTSAVPTK